MTTVQLSRSHHPVTTLGHGVRAGIWFQGCTIGCGGCVSRDTWAAAPERAVEVDRLLDWLAGLNGQLDGLTVSGGEPFQQPEALRDLLAGARARFGARGDAPFDLLVYSGYSVGRLRRDRRRAAALELCDAVVAGPYVDRLNIGQRWQGSSNQRLVPITALGHDRYGDGGTADRVSRPTLQIGVENDRIWAVGIPRRGDMDRLEARLRSAGVSLGGVSWHS